MTFATGTKSGTVVKTRSTLMQGRSEADKEGGLSHLPTTFQSLINIFSTQLLANGRGGRGGEVARFFLDIRKFLPTYRNYSGHTYENFPDIS